MRVRIKYSKHGLMKYIGHLDMMRYFQKACRRAGIDVVYTEGLSPHMSMSFALPLGVGMTSDSEYVDVDLAVSMPGSMITGKLNESVPEGVHFLDARQIPEGKAHKGMTLVAGADYSLRMRDESFWDGAWKEDFGQWLAQSEIMVLKKGKKTLKEINIRPLIFEAGFPSGDDTPAGKAPDLTLRLGAGLDRNIRPELVMQAFAESTGRPYRPFQFDINRDEVYADRETEEGHDFIPLIELGSIVL